VRWVLSGDTGAGMGFGGGDGRVGATTAMDAVASACRAVSTASSSGATLYDCQGQASAFR